MVPVSTAGISYSLPVMFVCDDDTVLHLLSSLHVKFVLFAARFPVWQGLEEENQDFFKAYYLKLLVKDQIVEFNRLLSEQVELMHQIGFSEVAPLLTSDGTHVSPSKTVFYYDYFNVFQFLFASFLFWVTSLFFS